MYCPEVAPVYNSDDAPKFWRQFVGSGTSDVWLPIAVFAWRAVAIVEFRSRMASREREICVERETCV